LRGCWGGHPPSPPPCGASSAPVLTSPRLNVALPKIGSPLVTKKQG